MNRLQAYLSLKASALSFMWMYVIGIETSVLPPLGPKGVLMWIFLSLGVL